MLSTKMGVILCIIIAVFASTVKAFPNGSHIATCLTMFPKHKTEQQMEPLPINITFSPSLYSPGQNITVTIAAMTGHVIRGIQIRAHRAEMNFDETVGRFVDWPTDKIKPQSCFGQLHNMVSHRNSEPRSDIILTWTAPGVNMGDIIFSISIVESFKLFWGNRFSPLLKPTDPTTVVKPATLQGKVNTSFEPINWSECGKTKGCLLYPRQCTGADCYAGLTFTKVAEGYTFEVFAKGEGYVSMGISHDRKMGKDHTVSCTAQGQRVTVQNGYNHDRYNERMMGLSLSKLQTSQEDGVIYCRFTRPQKMLLPIMPGDNGTPDVMSFDMDIEYFLFLTWGYTFQDSDTMEIHIEQPIISDHKINFRHYAVYRGSSFPFQPKVHGCLMMVAWIAMAGITVVLSRYFKEGVGGSLCLGAKTWFQLHRVCALLVFGLTAAGLAVILVYLEGEITDDPKTYNHACVGFTVVALVCAQLLMGFLRPSVNSKFRFLFNWLHRILGKIAQIFSAVTMMLAFQWEWVPRVARDFGVIVLGCWIGAQVLAEILLEVWHQCRNRRKADAKENINLDNTQPREMAEERQEPSPVPILLYLLVPLGFVCAALCSILLY